MTARILLLALIATSLVACSRNHEDLVEDSVSLVEKMAETMKSVKDKDSAEAAMDRFRDLVQEFKEIKEDAEDLPDLPDAEKEALQKKYAKRVEEAQKELMSALQSAGPHFALVSQEKRDQFGEDMKKLDIR